MPLPKALLCVLGKASAHEEESRLRQAGFATAVLRWEELAGKTQDWMQLSEILDDPAVQAWVIAGEPEAFSADVLSMTSLLALSLRRESQPGTALVLYGQGRTPELPPLMRHVKIWPSSEPFAAHLMAARFRPGATLATPFHVRAILSPLVGLWLEVAPADGRQEGFTIGALEAEISAFGVGPRGAVPRKSRLDYPVSGIQGAVNGIPFSACAARNAIGEGEACYCKVECIPRGVFLANYLTETEQDGEAELLPFVIS